MGSLFDFINRLYVYLTKYRTDEIGLNLYYVC